ncbi:hypothetical protein GMORB2_4530 [Geosmithia morbida]|uniref:non-specific serine/threonine protein kinase n=1 Tax=Geosmithia morbida TaxID=1094350 RepID=A0A9P4YQ80_9HYPO|nr:uncharacterized protein GMORB2_4530 [Geosmithia morbida]KAF4119621.1 hypothetical protein GMORB2_4530 [Geosmithia morbida]
MHRRKREPRRLHYYSRDPDKLWGRLNANFSDVYGILESESEFRKGGYMPVHLGDEIGDDGRYRVIHKLGFGSSGAVWLCRDLRPGPQDVPEGTTHYVAVKILMACPLADVEKQAIYHVRDRLLRSTSGSPPPSPGFERHLCLPLREFTCQSPNGTHICLVYPVLGPPASEALSIFYPHQKMDEKEHERDEGPLLPPLRKQDDDDDDDEEEEEEEEEEGGRCVGAHPFQDIFQETAEALALLHRHGICHGKLINLDGLEEDEVLELLGQPDTEAMVILEDAGLTPEIPGAPRYLVYSVDWPLVNPAIISTRSRLIAFGNSFFADSDDGTPDFMRRKRYKWPWGVPCYAPEMIYSRDRRTAVADTSSSTTAIDLWSLGCMLYEIRFAQPLFHIREQLSYRYTTVNYEWHFTGEVFLLLGKLPNPYPWYDFDEDLQSIQPGNDYASTAALVADAASSTNDGTDNNDERERLHRFYSIRKRVCRCHGCPLMSVTNSRCPRRQSWLICDDEAETLADLIERLLRFRPEDRLSAEGALKHDWLAVKYECSLERD